MKKKLVVAMGIIVLITGGILAIINLKSDNDSGWLVGNWQSPDSELNSTLDITSTKSNEISLTIDDQQTMKLRRVNKNTDEALVYKDSDGTTYKFIKVSNAKLKFILTAKEGLIGQTNALVYNKKSSIK
ncbi:hypothetical protein KUA55_02125 [Enterococcus sp. ALS3]|uniref:DUF5640 domain-containing protein n=1 Tax=Enterococcus alishanensis TaxID=1303817 RepID=A0ABS6T988_9ENTE|nr:hypothetical protein [Enterococcus alishanensis]MBV7389461.1 hypothetical protein [Enterococcus alishanensis]